MLKLDMTFENLEAVDWCNTLRLCQNFIAAHGTKVEKPHEALHIIVSAINNMSLKKKTFITLHDYAISCIEFLKLKHVKADFKKVYQDTHLQAQVNEEKERAHITGLRNGVALTIAGANEYYDNHLKNNEDDHDDEDDDHDDVYSVSRDKSNCY
jgi:hypothetical protein